MTRRKQFRMKAEKQEERKRRKEERQVAKAAAEAAGPKKRGRPRKETTEAEPTRKIEEKKQDLKAEKAGGSCPPPSKAKSSTNRSKGLTKLRKLKSRSFGLSSPTKGGEDWPQESHEDPKVKAKAVAASKERLNEKPKAASRKRAKPASGTSGLGPEAEPETNVGTKRTAKARKEQTQATEEPQAEAKVRERKARAKKAHKQPAEIDENVKNLVRDTLLECQQSECTHPNFEWAEVDPEVYQYSTYWSRMCAGIKIAAKYSGTVKQKAKKGRKTNCRKGQKMMQVAYFGCSTCCTYSNVALACCFVLWLYRVAFACL